MRHVVLAAMFSLTGGGVAHACIVLPPQFEWSAEALADDAIKRSSIIVDGYVEAETAAQAASRRRFPNASPERSIRPVRVFKGIRLRSYRVVDEAPMCFAGHETVGRLSTGAPVRLLLTPGLFSPGLKVWAAIDTSFYSGRLPAGSVEAVIDRRLGVPRDPRVALPFPSR